MSRLRLRIGHAGLDFDRDYGTDRLTGWSVVIGGKVCSQFVSFPRALWQLVRGVVTGNPASDRWPMHLRKRRP